MMTFPNAKGGKVGVCGWLVVDKVYVKKFGLEQNDRRMNDRCSRKKNKTKQKKTHQYI